VAIRRIYEPSHPCHGQLGLFATARLYVGQVVLEYTGYVLHPEQPRAHASQYCMSYSFAEPFDVDAAFVGNVRPLPHALNSTRFLSSVHADSGQESRFINHFDGIGQANVNFQPCLLDGVYRTLIVVMRPIPVGRELLADYGPAFFA
jgi:hypothetical protein